MSKLQVTISVNNPDEVIKKEKGKLIGFASKLLSKEKRKQRVEEELYQVVREELIASLPTRLSERGIDSEVTIELID